MYIIILMEVRPTDNSVELTRKVQNMCGNLFWGNVPWDSDLLCSWGDKERKFFPHQGKNDGSLPTLSCNQVREGNEH